MESMSGRVWTLSIERVGAAAPAFLGENPRLEKMFPHTRLLRVLGHVSRDGQWGWDGACLEWPSDASDDPKGYKAGDANLYRYCGNRPVIHVDPSGCGFWGSVGDFCYDYGRYLMHPSQMDPDLQVGNGIGYGMIGIGTGGLAGIGRG